MGKVRLVFRVSSVLPVLALLVCKAIPAYKVRRASAYLDLLVYKGQQASVHRVLLVLGHKVLRVYWVLRAPVEPDRPALLV